MNFEIISHRHAEEIISANTEYNEVYQSLENTINSISDDDLISQFYSKGMSRGKSLNNTLNTLIDERLKLNGWNDQTKIFKPDEYKNPWKLDFTKGPFSMEVAFNHGEATAWNLMKPVIASEINHVEQEFQTEIGIVIVASSNLKRIAGMDNAVKTFEEMKNFLKPLMAYLTVPILIIGLKEPETFTIEHFQNPTVTGTKKLLGVVKYNNGNYNIIPSEVEMWQNANSVNDRYFNYSDIQSQL